MANDTDHSSDAQNTQRPLSSSTNNEDATASSSLSEPSNEASTTEKDSETKISLKEYVCKVLWKDVLSIAVFCFIILRFVGFRAVVPSGSMEPTLEIGNSYIVSRLATYFDEYKGLEYLDVVVFTHEAEFGNDDFIVKRVIGLPGDVISIESGKVYRNGEALTESYVKNKEYSVNLEEFVIPDHEIFVLGDNRQSSHDGRFWQVKTVNLDDVVGEMIFLSK